MNHSLDLVEVVLQGLGEVASIRCLERWLAARLGVAGGLEGDVGGAGLGVGGGAEVEVGGACGCGC